MSNEAQDLTSRTRRANGLALLVWLWLPAACGPGIVPAQPPPPGSGPEPSTDPSTEPSDVPDGSWTLVALPDTQNVVSSYPEILFAQTAFIATHADRLNIKYVVTEGDITNNSTDEQWDVADHAFRLLDERVPYAMTMGNHDYSGGGNPDRRDTSKFDEHFSPDRQREQLGFVGMFEPTSAANAAYRLDGNGQAWLIFALEFGPRDAVLDWVARVLADHPTANAILVTHAYLFLDGTRFDHTDGDGQYHNPHDYESDGSLGGVNDGQEMWDKLIEKSPQIRLVLCGHMHGEARLTSARPSGPPVHQLLADYQSEAKGGAGYTRLLTFWPDGKVSVSTYSPFLQRFRTDEDSEFVLEL